MSDFVLFNLSVVWVSTIAKDKALDDGLLLKAYLFALWKEKKGLFGNEWIV
jgi:hypothetical protein